MSELQTQHSTIAMSGMRLHSRRMIHKRTLRRKTDRTRARDATIAHRLNQTHHGNHSHGSGRRRGGLGFSFVCVGRHFSVRYRSPKEPAPVTGFWCLTGRRVVTGRQSRRSRASTQLHLFAAAPKDKEPQGKPTHPPGLRRVRRNLDRDKDRRSLHPITECYVAL